MRGKIAMPVIAALLVLGVIGGSALAGEPTGLEFYDAGGSTQAFDLQVASGAIPLAGGYTMSLLTSDGPKSSGYGFALLTPDGGLQGEALSEAPAGPADAEGCPVDIEEQFPSPIDTAGIQIGCVVTTATDAQHSTGESKAIRIGVLGSGLSDQLTDALLGPLTEALSPVFDGLDPVTCDLLATTILGGTCPDDGSLLGGVVDELTGALGDPNSVLVDVAVAPGNSGTSADDTTGVTGSALSNGAVIKLMPNALLYGTDPTTGEPNAALTIRVGPTRATATADPVTGAITTDASVGLVELETGEVDTSALGGMLGLDTGDGTLVQVTDALNGVIASLADANALACGNADNPLAAVICLSAGEALTDLGPAELATYRPDFDFGEGTLGAYAVALGLVVVPDAADAGAASVDGGVTTAAATTGLVSLQLSEAVAAVNAMPVKPVVTTTAAPPTSALPRTGPTFSGDNVLPLVMALGLGTGALAIRMRRRARLN